MSKFSKERLEEAFDFFDYLFLEKSLFHLGDSGPYRALQDSKGWQRMEAWDAWCEYKRSPRFKEVQDRLAFKSGNYGDWLK